ncbi:MAG: FHIPEP family type III secretion protein, partial [Planctomycetaceae bacterium]
MPPGSGSGLREGIARHRGLIFPVLIVTSVLVIVAPLPSAVIDVLLACNITVSVVVLLTTIHVARPLDFSVFPALVLGTTLARLVLNVASTRLILTRGAIDGTAAAGGVIEAFGDFVAGGDVVIGLILFIILVAIQFLVITKGATRISEVAARFALDGLPGKQMAIDADLHAGLVTPEEAQRRRQEVAQQADFYGAMDGAGKFVRGDAVAGLIITLINIAGGLYVGMVQHDMPFAHCVEIFTRLTIGDGLVAQVPAFLISLAAGLIVTRSSAESDLPRDVVGQLFGQPVPLFLAAAFLVCLAFTGLPALPMLALGGGCAAIGLGLRRSRSASRSGQENDHEPPASQPAPRPEDRLQVDPLELQLGYALIRLADAATGDLLERVARLRHELAEELGIILPKVRIRDDLRLGPREYRIKIRGVAVAGGDVRPDRLLAIDSGAAGGELSGLEAIGPAFDR